MRHAQSSVDDAPNLRTALRRALREPADEASDVNNFPNFAQVYRQRIDGAAELAFEDLDEAYYVHVHKSSDEQLIMVNSGATLQNEILYVPADEPACDFKVGCLACIVVTDCVGPRLFLRPNM